MKLFTFAMLAAVLGFSGQSSDELQITVLPSEVIVNEETTLMVSGLKPDEMNSQFEWSFENEEKIKTEKHYLVHVFTKPGVYKLKLRIKKEGEESQAVLLRKRIKVLNVNIKPTPRFSISDKTPSVDQEVVFRSRAVDEDGKITERAWLLGKSAMPVSREKVFKFSFKSSGWKSIRHKVVDDRGAEAQLLQKIYVRPKEEAVKLRISSSRRIAAVGQKIKFKAKVKPANYESIDWFFSDGSQKSGEKVDHAFQEPGRYVVRAKVSLRSGQSYEKSLKIRVRKKRGLKRRSVAFVDPALVATNSPSRVELGLNSQDAMTFQISAFDLDINGQDQLSTVTWVVDSSGIISISSLTSDNRDIEITALSAGIVSLQAKVGNVLSLPIEVEVVAPSTNGLEVLGGHQQFVKRRDQKYVAVLDPKLNTTFSVSADRGENSVLVDSISDDDAETDVLRALLRPGNNTTVFTAVDDVNNPTDTRTKTKNLRFFDGRGAALSFTSETQEAEIRLQENPLYSFNKSFSLSFWTRPEENVTSTTTANITGFGVFDWGINLYGPTEGLSEFNLYDRIADATRRVVGGVTGDAHLGEWRHIAISFDQSSSKISFFQDGVKRSELTLPSTPEAVGQQSIKISNFIGQIDEMRFWNKALTDQEVADELFSPQDEDSFQSTAFFSFDSEKGQIVAADNSSDDVMVLGEFESYDAKDPSFSFASEIVATKSLFKSTGGSLFVDGDELRKFDVEGRIEFRIRKDQLSEDQSIEIEVSDASLKGFSYSESYANAISPIVRLHTSEGTQTALLDGASFNMKIPFDPTVVTDPSDLLVYSTKFSEAMEDATVLRLVSAVKPVYVDMQRGELSFRANSLGSFWVSTASSLLPSVSYTSPEFSEHPYNGFDENMLRKFYTKVTASGSPPPSTVDVSLATTSFFDELEFFSCDTMPTQTNLPSLITGLPVSEISFCHLSYLKKDTTAKVFIRQSDELTFDVAL